MTRVYIESYNGFPIDDWACSAYYGFRDKGFNVILFEDLEEVPLSKNVILVANISDTEKYLKRLGMTEDRLALNIPPELMKYTGRKISYTTMGEFRSNTPSLPIFLKPGGKHKEFGSAGVMSKPSSIDFFKDVPDDVSVLVSEVVDFVSEYRGYVINGQLKGLHFYNNGDFRIFPDVKVIEEAIKDYVNQPAGYSIDFGVTSDGRTLLIECNMGYSLGNYGLDNETYATLLTRCWYQLIGRTK